MILYSQVSWVRPLPVAEAQRKVSRVRGLRFARGRYRWSVRSNVSAFDWFRRPRPITDNRGEAADKRAAALMSYRPFLILIRLDGFGCRKESDRCHRRGRDACFDRLYRESRRGRRSRSGRAVGLPRDQMGNSEVGQISTSPGRRPHRRTGHRPHRQSVSPTRAESESCARRCRQAEDHRPVFCRTAAVHSISRTCTD